MITLSSVNDAYTVSLTPNSCIINAKWNGDIPDYSNAKAQLTVYRGDAPISFHVTEVLTTNINEYKYDQNLDGSYNISINKIQEGKLSGQLKFHLNSGTDFDTWVTLPITVVRETSMLDWIVDWEQNKKTTLTGDYILTPKLYAGSISDGKLTGTYIGPSFEGNGHSGIYGYKDQKRIFHLDDTGGMIGGWTIDECGINSGNLQLLSSGSIRAINSSGIPIWSINADGSAFFGLNEGITLNGANGNATFKGTLEAENGHIGGWHIGAHSLYNGSVLIDSDNGFIGISGAEGSVDEPTVSAMTASIKLNGGVILHHTNSTSFGIKGYDKGRMVSHLSTITPNAPFEYTEKEIIRPSLPELGKPALETTLFYREVFCLGASNHIAGWHFDAKSLWSGEDTENEDGEIVYARVNTEGAYTTIPGAITIGSNGMRGNTWYIDKDGSASFANGLVKFNEVTGIISGWQLTGNKIANEHIALTSESASAGLYLTAANGDFVTKSPGLIENFIESYGGIYLNVKPDSADFAAYNSNGSRLFKIKNNGLCYIAGWTFDDLTLYTGTKATTGFSSASGSITLGPTGLRGYKWRLESNGSGALANGNISWGTDGSGSVAQGKIAWFADGSITLDASVKIAWTSVTGTEGVTNKLTKIDANGIYTGTISANNITAGTISTADIKNESGTWYLNQDGSGALANRNISWTADGSVKFTGEITAKLIKYQLTDEQSPWGEGNGNGSIIDEPFRAAMLGGDCVYKLPHLQHNEFRVIKFLGILTSRSGGHVTFNVENINKDTIYYGTQIYGTESYKTIILDDSKEFGLGYYELVGYGNGDYTSWHLIKLSC